MFIIKFFFCVLLLYMVYCDVYKEPTILISIIARNKGHILPYFLSFLEGQSYPKDRISLWIRSDHNIDKTNKILEAWIDSVGDVYHSIDFVLDEEEAGAFEDEKGPAHWPVSRFKHVIQLREQALDYARNIWADYILQLDCDALLTNPNTISDLVSKKLIISAPMLKSDGLYSNFWSGMTDEYYYARTDRYKPILNREDVGCFPVPMVHTCVLIDLRRKDTDRLTYNPKSMEDYDGPLDDIITFALSANRSDIEMYVCNNIQYGFVTVPLEQQDPLSHDLLQLTNIKLEALAEGVPVNLWKDLVPSVQSFLPQRKQKDKMGFDKIYMINLKRRPERRDRMNACFEELGLEAEILDAVDGRALNESVLSKIHIMPDYTDPYHGRTMTLGEIGCFLSHLEIWRKVVASNPPQDVVLVLEDDIRFEPFFRARVGRLLEELKRLDWDLVYLGRKRLQDQEEPWVPGSRMLVKAGYSYWTLGYALTFKGAKKLLEADPLEKLLPVDEYLPILFDRHPKANWKGHYPQRDLVALSVSPLLLYPTHYTGDKGYVSDTEDSDIITNILEKEQKIHGDL